MRAFFSSPFFGQRGPAHLATLKLPLLSWTTNTWLYSPLGHMNTGSVDWLKTLLIFIAKSCFLSWSAPYSCLVPHIDSILGGFYTIIFPFFCLPLFPLLVDQTSHVSLYGYEYLPQAPEEACERETCRAPSFSTLYINLHQAYLDINDCNYTSPTQSYSLAY